MRRIFIGGLGAGRSFGKRLNHGRFMPPAVISRACVGNLPIALLP
jgi:hypothetical protein